MHIMSLYEKQTLPVRFLQFNVDAKGVIVPILRRGKNGFLGLTPTTRLLELKRKVVPESRQNGCESPPRAR